MQKVTFDAIFCCSGKSFLEYIDELPSLTRSVDGPLRIPISERYKVSKFNHFIMFVPFFAVRLLLVRNEHIVLLTLLLVLKCLCGGLQLSTQLGCYLW